MAWPHCERSMACPRYERSMACPHEHFISFTHPPIKPFCLLQPTSIPTVLTASPHSLFVLMGRGGGFFTINPSRASTSDVIPVLYPTNVTASSVTTSCATPVILSLQIMLGNVPLDYFPVSYVGYLISDTIEFPLL